MIQIGDDKIKDIYVGSDKIKGVYYGSEKVWEGVEGYWVHKDTGVKTDFGLEDPSIVNGIMSSPSWATLCSEVKIPLGILELANDCFRGCTSLTSITLPESITLLRDYCFYECTALTSVALSEGVTNLGNYCFRYCSSLTSINIPESVIGLRTRCFSDCISLTSINIPESVNSLGNYCFRGCSSLSLATVLPAIPPTLGTQAFNSVHTSFNIKVRPPYVNAYKTATNWIAHASIISAI